MSESEPRSVDFEPVREIWNKYKLETDVTLRNKFSLKRLVSLRKKQGQVGYSFGLDVLTEVDIPPKVVTDSSTLIKPIQINNEDIEKEIKFTVISNRDQIYDAENNTYLFVTETMHKIYSTKKTDNFGRPAYVVEVTGDVSIFNTKKSRAA